MQMQYSSSEFLGLTPGQQRNASQDSKSFYTDISAASIPITVKSALLTPQQVILTKSVAAALRFKSRRIANFFWRWKYTQVGLGAIGRSTIHGVTQQTGGLDADSEVADLMKKYKLLDQDETSQLNQPMLTDENIDDEDEAVISKQKKKGFEQPVQYAGPEKRGDYDFAPNEIVGGNSLRKNDPTKKPDDGSPKPQIFYQILNSRNKDFGKILRTSNSVTSVNSYEEIGGNVQMGHSTAVDEFKLTTAVYAKAKATLCAEKFLKMKLRRCLRHWRGETETYLQDVRFRLGYKRMLLQREKVVRIIGLKVSNEKALMRQAFFAFSRWRMETEVEKRALDRR